MNPDLEQLFAQLKPCPTAGQLRSKVLSAIDGQLRESRHWRMQKRIGLCTLAMLIFSVGLNFWVDQTVSQRLVALFPPPAAPRQAVELAAFISKYADPQAGQWVYQQIIFQQSTEQPSEEYFGYLQKIADVSDIIFKDLYHEKSEKNPSLDGNRRRMLPARRSCLPVCRTRWRLTAASAARRATSSCRAQPCSRRARWSSAIILRDISTLNRSLKLKNASRIYCSSQRRRAFNTQSSG